MPPVGYTVALVLLVAFITWVPEMVLLFAMAKDVAVVGFPLESTAAVIVAIVTARLSANVKLLFKAENRLLNAGFRLKDSCWTKDVIDIPSLKSV